MAFQPLVRLDRGANRVSITERQRLISQSTEISRKATCLVNRKGRPSVGYVTCAALGVMGMASRASLRWRRIHRFEPDQLTLRKWIV